MLSKEKIKQIRKFHDKKGRTESGLFLVEGRKMILELLASDWKDEIEELYVSEKLFEEIIAISSPLDKGRIVRGGGDGISKISTLENNSDGVAVVRQNKIKAISHSNSLHAKPHPNPLLKEREQTPKMQPHLLLEEKNCDEVLCERGTSFKNWTLILDGIRDPGNMGTILRTASWFGIQKIVCSQDSVELYNPKVVSATMGALFHLQISYENLEDFYEKNTLPVYAAELGGTDIGEIAFPKTGVLVMGSESHGISEISRKYMTQGILIPKIGYGESLNVGIATGILLSHIVK